MVASLERAMHFTMPRDWPKKREIAATEHFLRHTPSHFSTTAPNPFAANTM
jgi:hypothetical protein